MNLSRIGSKNRINLQRVMFSKPFLPSTSNVYMDKVRNSNNIVIQKHNNLVHRTRLLPTHYRLFSTGPSNLMVKSIETEQLTEPPNSLYSLVEINSSNTREIAPKLNTNMDQINRDYNRAVINIILYLTFITVVMVGLFGYLSAGVWIF